MLRTSTSSILHRRKCSNDKTNHTILRSSHNIPRYQDIFANDAYNNMDGYPEENRVGNFNVLNENNHPGVVYYFIQVTNPDDIIRSSTEIGNNNNNNNNNNNSNNSNGNQNRNV